MKILAYIGLTLLLVIGLSSCGLVSGTLFVSQELDGNLHAESEPGGIRDGGISLDTEMDGVVVNLLDNEDYGDIDVNGIEAGCVKTHAINCNQNLPVSGEVWITLDTTLQTDDPAVVMANGFRVFSGIALQPGEERDFTCEETLEMLENLDQFADAINTGYFKAWGMGNEDFYCISLTNIYIGMFLTGSLE